MSKHSTLFNPGIYCFNKPVGWTSFDVVNWVKHRAVTTKVGHAGTLDPAAEGLLIVAVGREHTKHIDEIAGKDKEYIFEITFGIVTDTYDREGKVIRETTNFNLSKELLLTTLEKFKGAQQQIPPMFSAIKKDGQKLYNLARKGIEIERQPRNIMIYELDLEEFTGTTAKIRVICSKGTYIRSLCYDIGENLGLGAYMSKLLRTRIGTYTLDDSSLVPEPGRKA